MRIKIISAGMGRTTTIVNADTGEALENIKSVTWRVGPGGGPAVANIELVLVPVEVIGEVEPTP